MPSRTRALQALLRNDFRAFVHKVFDKSLKSASVAFPAFLLGHDPSRRIICVSYSRDLAKKHSNDFRAVPKTEETRRLPALEVILRRLANDAMRSEPRALKLLLALYDRYGDSPQTDLRRRDSR